MERSKFGERQDAHLDPAYQNGQSDAEKLMHKHLQSDEPITDNELEGIEITKPAAATESTPTKARDKGDDSDEAETGFGKMLTPLDVLGG